jgi:hypothetical protein
MRHRTRRSQAPRAGDGGLESSSADVLDDLDQFVEAVAPVNAFRGSVVAVSIRWF